MSTIRFVSRSALAMTLIAILVPTNGCHRGLETETTNPLVGHWVMTARLVDGEWVRVPEEDLLLVVHFTENEFNAAGFERLAHDILPYRVVHLDEESMVIEAGPHDGLSDDDWQQLEVTLVDENKIEMSYLHSDEWLLLERVTEQQARELSDGMTAKSYGNGHAHELDLRLKIDKAKEDVKSLQLACEYFRRDVGAPPDSLRDLRSPPQDIDSVLWRGPYWYESDGFLEDPWGNQYRIDVVEIDDRSVARVTSAGPDEEFRTEDDVQHPAGK